MWPRVRHVAHVVANYASIVAVTGIGLTLLYRSTELSGGSRDRALFFGVALIIAAWMWTWGRERRHRLEDRVEFENTQQYMRERQRALEQDLAEVRSEVDTEVARNVFLHAMEESEEWREPPWGTAYRKTP